MRFEPGQIVLRRYFQRAQSVSLVTCARVVSDDERGLLLWVEDGSPACSLRAVDGRRLRGMSLPEWAAAPKRQERWAWQGGILVLMPPEAANSIWWFWRDDRPAEFAAWYVNLEAPATRWCDRDVAGVDTVDHDLDIVVRPDRSWRWKDEDEFAERSAYPEHYWVDDPAAVRAEGERVVKLIEAGGFPFDGTWCDFRPDPAWTVPDELPAGWDRPRAPDIRRA
jgi:hypothetical protein